MEENDCTRCVFLLSVIFLFLWQEILRHPVGIKKSLGVQFSEPKDARMAFLGCGRRPPNEGLLNSFSAIWENGLEGWLKGLFKRGQ